MEYEEKHIKRLRKYVNDVDATLFDNEELGEILEESSSVYATASKVWTIRAGLLQGEIESYSTGQEKYDLTPLKDRLDHALKMVAHYKELAGGDVDVSSSGFMLKVQRPEVM
ncbi:hypothetical protein [Bacillus sp. FJAT-45350]|uniref:hypothetical protein n=1 Tax=Bacillus sp. FJAT-45350 TaxID=2011014 RepID=UPI000BB8A428|nr:hypothetical protein [Bacillus sp. FJAT-45350]